MTEARSIARISFTVRSLAEAEDFFAQLGFVSGAKKTLDRPETMLLGLREARAERLVMRLGAQGIELLSFDPPGRPYPADSTATDLWFQHIAIVVCDMAEAYERVLIAGATPITVGPPETLPPNTGRVTAYKFREPNGHPLELLAFPPNEGDPLWHRAGATAPFLGIDHTAIVVADPVRSAAFYRTLGFEPQARSLNQGPEQARLDDVARDVAEVVALTLPRAPPHLELLGYRVGTRRPRPAGMAANDVAATRTMIDAVGIDPTVATILADGSRACRLEDPDGHVLILRDASATD